MPSLVLSLVLVLLLLRSNPAEARRHTFLPIAGQWGAYGRGGDGGPAHLAGLSIDGGGSLVLDSNGNIIIADTFNNCVRKVIVKTGIITAVACTKFEGYSGDNGPATAATCGRVYGVAIDTSDNIYFSDSSFHVVRKVTAATGIITTVAGSGGNGASTGDGGLATSAKLSYPYWLALDSITGNLYIAELYKIRVVSASTGIINTYAGTGTWGHSGDGGLATSAQIYFNTGGPVIDGAGNIYFSHDSRVRKIDAATKIISTIAGGGSITPTRDGRVLALDANFQPNGLFVHPTGFPIYVGAYGSLYVINSTGHTRQVLGPEGADRAEIGTTGRLESSPKDPDMGHYYGSSVIPIESPAVSGGVSDDPILLVSLGSMHVVGAYIPESLFSGAQALFGNLSAASACNFTSVGQRDLVGSLLLHTSATHESSCQLACCSRPACEGYSFSPRPTTAAYEANHPLQASFWRRVSDEPSAWHSSCYLLSNVTSSVYSNAMRSGVRSSLLS